MCDMSATVCETMAGKRCGHTFCNDCIHDWLQKSSSCPSCRQNTSFKPVTTRIVLSQLDRLHVRCRHCHKDDIEKGDFKDHIRHRCPQVVVRCKAADLKCHWTGSREAEAQHADICSLLQIRPVVEELKAEIAAQGYQLQIFANEIRQLQDQLTRPAQSSRTTTNTAQGSSEDKRYQELMDNMERTWQFSTRCCYCEECVFCDNSSTRFFRCIVCLCRVARGNVRAHDSSSETYAVICLTCVAEYS